jgi:phosphatidylserine decarboxylase
LPEINYFTPLKSLTMEITKMTKDGLSIIFVALGITVVTLLIAIVTKSTPIWVLFILFLLFTAFSLYFFRDPERVVPGGSGLFVSPADGKVVEIVEEDNQYMGGRARRISIFLNVFNVHVNRIPCDGTIDYYQYYKGKFMAAWNEKASLDNEQTHIGINCGDYKILVKQIAGLIARRIVCRAKEGVVYKRGDRFGMIKFGSRTDIFLPLNMEVKVKVGDKVEGATTIIAVQK